MTPRPSNEKTRSRLANLWMVLTPPLVSILAILTALLVASVALLLSRVDPLRAYAALMEGALGNKTNIIETLIKATPYIIAGLGVALGFRGGLFNIGTEGQLFVGSIMAVLAGTLVKMPVIFHIPFVLLAGFIGGGIWAGIPGYLKARLGAQEVITTIMMNFIALRIITWLIGANGPLRAKSMVPETNPLLVTARLPELIPGTRLHAGVLLALILAVVVYWLLFRSVTGFEIRTIGSNANAARYSGMHVERNIVLIMFLSGGLAGLAGAVQVMGLSPYNFTTGFNVGYGFDSIAVAVLGASHPFGVVFSALLFGAMNAGARIMQLRARVPIDIISILQGLILMFVAADQIIRSLYHIRSKTEQKDISMSQSWAGKE